MPMMIESQFLALTNRAAVQWTKEFQQHVNNAIDSFRDHLRSAANTARMADDNSANNVTRAAGPMGSSGA
jgi:flagellar hook-basal body complex protein FliE